MSQSPSLIDDLVRTLEQGVMGIASLDPELYAQSPEPLASSGIGPHVRHGLDACLRLLEGLESGRVDYDRRAREARIEVDAAWAVRRIRETILRLRSLDARETARPLFVRMDVPENTPERAGWQRSSFGRELAFVLSHTIHHYALIAMIMRHHGVEPPADFGVAPSTLRFWEESERCAPQPG